MAIDLKSAAVGYDQSGLEDYINQIKMNVIEKTADDIEKEMNTQMSAVSDYWVGESAEAFKELMKSDVAQLKNAFTAIETGLENNLHIMGQDVVNSDNAIANSINAIIGGTSVASSSIGNSGTQSTSTDVSRIISDVDTTGTSNQENNAQSLAQESTLSTTTPVTEEINESASETTSETNTSNASHEDDDIETLDSSETDKSQTTTSEEQSDNQSQDDDKRQDQSTQSKDDTKTSSTEEETQEQSEQTDKEKENIADTTDKETSTSASQTTQPVNSTESTETTDKTSETNKMEEQSVEAASAKSSQEQTQQATTTQTESKDSQTQSIASNPNSAVSAVSKTDSNTLSSTTSSPKTEESLENHMPSETLQEMKKQEAKDEKATEAQESSAAYVESLVGKGAIEYGSATGTQCVELSKKVAAETIGADLSNAALGNGDQIYKNIAANSNGVYEAIDYTDGMELKPGDIVSMRGAYHADAQSGVTTPGYYGHTGVVTSINPDGTYNLAEQWAGSGVVKESVHTIHGGLDTSDGIYGVARPTGITNQDSATK